MLVKYKCMVNIWWAGGLSGFVLMHVDCAGGKKTPECQCRFCRAAVHKLSGFMSLKTLVYRYDRHLSHFLSWNSPGHSHDTEDGRRIPLAAEVGLLTRNIQIKSDVACAGRMLVGRFTDSSGTEFEGSWVSPVFIDHTSSAQESTV